MNDIESSIETDIDHSIEIRREICWHCKHVKAWHDLILGCDYFTDGNKCDCREYQEDAS